MSWDHYNGEDAVLIEEIDNKSTEYMNHLKQWTDKYSCRRNCKYGTVLMENYTKFGVTSQFDIDTTFALPPLTSEEEKEKRQIHCDALKRRFKQVHFIHPYNERNTNTEGSGKYQPP